MPRPSHASLLLTTRCLLWRWPSSVAWLRMPLSSGVTSSDSRYSIVSWASSSNPSHVDLMHHGCIAELSYPGSHSFAPQRGHMGRVASNWAPTGSWSRRASRCHCACCWWWRRLRSTWAAVRGHRACWPWSPRGGSPGCCANTGTGAMCCTNCAPGVASSASACAGGRPCPKVNVGGTRPTRMSSVLVLVQWPEVASKSMPESTDPRLNFWQRLTRRRRRLRRDCMAIWLAHGDLDALECASVALMVLDWLAIGGVSVAGRSLAKPRAAFK